MQSFILQNYEWQIYGPSWTNFILTQPSHEIAFIFPWNRITIFFCKTTVKYVKKLLNKSYAFRTAMVYTNVIRQKICIKESIFSVLASKSKLYYIVDKTNILWMGWQLFLVFYRHKLIFSPHSFYERS